MIFHQLTLENFGQYKGVHILPLGINQTEPILLIGGHNGGGKTTILDAMQLCLYGKRSNCYRRADQRWDEYLRAWINRDSDFNVETRIRLDFDHSYEGKDTDFRVEFSWRTTGKKIQERKDIFVNNILDQLITATWEKFIDSILPARLSTLFFFDGEQIENLVRPETSQQFLESAITELLGIGIIEQLQRDLNVLNRNKLLGNKTHVEAEKLKEAEDEFANMEKKICHLEEHLAMLRKQKKSEQKQLKILDSEYESNGGKLLDEQAANEVLKKEMERQLEKLNKQIIREESGILPLYLVKDQLQKIKLQYHKEKEFTDCIYQQKQLDRLCGKYLKVAEQHGASDKVLNALLQFSTKERESMGNRLKDTTIYLNLPTTTIPALEATLELFPKIEIQYKQLKNQRAQLEKRINYLTDRLDVTPEKDILKTLYTQRRDRSKSISNIEMEFQTKEELLEQTRVKSRQQKERVIRLLEESAQETVQFEDNKRTVLYSLKAQQHLTDFRKNLLNKHLKRLESYILESFQHLIEKRSLVHRLQIKVSTFSIILTNREGKVIPSEKLSAGERQLLAIAIFWGLQKASNRPIPVMIDTPMGRLDSNHRNHLVRRYFPFAAHQVILLSTDEEIIGDYYTQISNYTSNEWTIAYDEISQSTQIKEGYF